jgi:hypothetical protein
MPTETAGVLHRPTTLAKPFRPAFEGPQAGAVVQEASTLEGSSPKASSTTAKATEPLWGSTPIKTFMRTHLRFGRTSAIGAGEGHSSYYFVPCTHLF